jgi:hypothetical protein
MGDRRGEDKGRKKVKKWKKKEDEFLRYGHVFLR